MKAKNSFLFLLFLSCLNLNAQSIDYKVVFDITRQGNKTQLLFTHEGLIPEFECFNACSGGWNYYLHNSLVLLITTGQGNPDKKENKKVESETVH